MRQKLWKIEQNKDPYTGEEENEIFLQMFRNNEVRKYCEQSTIYYDNILLTHAKISEILDSFRKMYNGLYRWSNAKLLNRLRDKWKIVETIQDNHVRKLYKNSESMKKELESKNLLDKNKVEVVKSEPEVEEDDSGILRNGYGEN